MISCIMIGIGQQRSSPAHTAGHTTRHSLGAEKMTTLTFNMQEKMTALFNKYGVFFAFSDEQFLRQRVEGVEYTTFGAGSVVPVNNYNAFIEEFNKLDEEEAKFNLEKFDKEDLILDELRNYECFYTWDINEVVEIMASKYKFTREDVEQVFNKYKDKYS